jgi:hypothetical protein
MKIIAIDPGDKNLAIVFFNVNVFSDFFFGSVTCGKRKKHSITEATSHGTLMETLENIFQSFETDGCVAFIEQQRSMKMFGIAACVAAICYRHSIPVMKFNPMLKLRQFKNGEKMSHYQNKKLAISVVNELLTSDNCSFIDKFSELKKKDDVADCVLMINFILKNPDRKWSYFHE